MVLVRWVTGILVGGNGRKNLDTQSGCSGPGQQHELRPTKTARSELHRRLNLVL